MLGRGEGVDPGDREESGDLSNGERYEVLVKEEEAEENEEEGGDEDKT